MCRLLQCLGKQALNTLVIQQSLRHSFNALIPCFSSLSQLRTLDLRFPLDFLPSFCKAAPPRLQELTLELSILLFSDLNEAVKRLQKLAILTNLQVGFPVTNFHTSVHLYGHITSESCIFSKLALPQQNILALYYNIRFGCKKFLCSQI